MVRGKIIKSKVLIRVWACLVACLMLVCSVPISVSAKATVTDWSAGTGFINGFTKDYQFYFGVDEAVYINDKTVSFSAGSAAFSFDTGPLASGKIVVDDHLDYDYLILSMYGNYASNAQLSLVNSNDYVEFIYSALPYIVVNGEKFYITNDWNGFKMDYSFVYLGYYIGYEIDVVMNFNTSFESSYDSILNYFGEANLRLTCTGFDYSVHAFTYVTSGDNAIIDSLDGVDTKVEVQIEKSEEEIDLQEEQNALQEEANTLQEENNETQKNIFAKIVDFFDNFFSRLGDFLLHIIVPSAEELTAFLDEVNAWFGERLGFLWFPFSFAIEVVQVFSSGTADSNFRVPGFSLNILGTEYQIWNEITVDMDAFGIFKYVRFFTSALLIGGVVKLAVNKWDAWIGGRSAS